MAAEKDIEIYRGDTYVHEVRLKDGANANINITAMSFVASMKTSVHASSNTAVFDVEKTNNSNGIFTFTMTSANSANIRPGVYVYDLQQTNGSVVTTLLQGKVTVKADVS